MGVSDAERKIAIAVLLAGIGAACGGSNGKIADRSKLKVFAPLHPTLATAGVVPNPLQVQLGRVLYHDARLSRKQDVSCNSCHPLSSYGTDGATVRKPWHAAHEFRNAPSVYNAAAQFRQFWDGRVRTLSEELSIAPTDAAGTGIPSEKYVVAVLGSMPEYVAAFQKAFPGGGTSITLQNVAAALEAFQQVLVTPSRWDRFLQGDEGALTPEEKTGFNAFVSAGCQACHSGMLVGGQAYERIGMMNRFPDTADAGRYSVTKAETDRMFFKIPSLRNVARTAPYFHNGSALTLPEAVSQMAHYQLSAPLSDEHVQSIVAWLQALTGELPAAYLAAPELPASTSTTPKPLN